MKLYQFPYSPYCIPISLILENADIDFKEVYVPSWDRSEVMRVTNGAYYQVPVLEDGDKVVYESSDSSLDVARYVDGLIQFELFPHPISGIHEVLINHIESELEGIGFKIGDPDHLQSIEDIVHRTNIVRHKERRFGKDCMTEWHKNKDKLIAAFYSEIDSFKGTLESNLFLFGEKPVYADYALYGVIGNVHYIPANARMEGREWLKDWMDRLSQFKLK